MLKSNNPYASKTKLGIGLLLSILGASSYFLTPAAKMQRELNKKLAAKANNEVETP